MKPLPIPMKRALELIAVRTENTASCHLWVGHMAGKQSQATPVICITIQGQQHFLQPRRILYQSVYGDLEKNDLVRLTCGLDRCINPEHFKKESRSAFISRLWKSGKLTRSNLPVRPYAEDMVKEIVRRYQAGETQDEIAVALQISQAGVGHIVRGRSRTKITRLPRTPSQYWRRLRHPKGDANAAHKLTWQEVLVIAGLWRAGYSQQAITDNFPLSLSQIERIQMGTAWGWLTDRGALCRPPQDLRTKDGRRRAIGEAHRCAVLTEAQVLEIAKLAGLGMKPKAIATTLGISHNATSMVLRGRTWSWLTGIQPRTAKTSSPQPDDSHPDEALVREHWRGGQSA